MHASIFSIAAITAAAFTCALPQHTSNAGGVKGAGRELKADEYKNLVLLHHNAHRKNHSSPDLSWDHGLEETALKIAKKCVYGHDTSTDGGNYGQNIAAGMRPDQVSGVISDLFYNSEAPHYTYGSEGGNSGGQVTGHFTQVVWKGTNKVACVTHHCAQGLGNFGSGKPYFTVCNYKPAGNFRGRYQENVLKPKGDRTIDGSSLLNKIGGGGGGGTGSSDSINNDGGSDIANNNGRQSGGEGGSPNNGNKKNKGHSEYRFPSKSHSQFDDPESSPPTSEGNYNDESSDMDEDQASDTSESGEECDKDDSENSYSDFPDFFDSSPHKGSDSGNLGGYNSKLGHSILGRILSVFPMLSTQDGPHSFAHNFFNKAFSSTAANMHSN